MCLKPIQTRNFAHRNRTPRVLCQHSEEIIVKALVSANCPEKASKVCSFLEKPCLAAQASTEIVVHRQLIRCPAGKPQCPGYGARLPPTEKSVLGVNTLPLSAACSVVIGTPDVSPSLVRLEDCPAADVANSEWPRLLSCWDKRPIGRTASPPTAHQSSGWALF